MSNPHATVQSLIKYLEQYSSDNDLPFNFMLEDVTNYFITGVVSNTSLETVLLATPSFEVLSIIFERTDIDNTYKKLLSDNYIKLRGYRAHPNQIS